MRDGRVPQRAGAQTAHHGELQRPQQLAAPRPQHAHTQQQVCFVIDHGPHQARRLAHLDGPRHPAHGQGVDARGGGVTFGLLGVHADAPQLRVGEQGVRDQPVRRAAGVAVHQRVTHDAVVVVRHVGEGRASFNIAQGMNVGRRGPEVFVCHHVAVIVSRNARRLKVQALGIGAAPGGDQQHVGAQIGGVSARILHRHDRLPTLPAHLLGRVAGQHLYPLALQHPPQLGGHIGVFAGQQAVTVLHHRDPAAQAGKGLGQFQADVAAAQHQQTLRQNLQFQRAA